MRKERLSTRGGRAPRDEVSACSAAMHIPRKILAAAGTRRRADEDRRGGVATRLRTILDVARLSTAWSELYVHQLWRTPSERTSYPPRARTSPLMREGSAALRRRALLRPGRDARPIRVKLRAHGTRTFESNARFTARFMARARRSRSASVPSNESINSQPHRFYFGFRLFVDLQKTRKSWQPKRTIFLDRVLLQKEYQWWETSQQLDKSAMFF